MEPIKLPEDISHPDRIEATKPIGQDQKMPLPEQTFSDLMKEPLATSPTEQRLPSPMELAGGQPLPSTGPSYTNLIGQIQGTQNTVNDLRNQLQTPNLNLKQSQKYLLQNKLTEANANLRSANIKMGIENPPEPSKPVGPTPIDKFLAYVSDGQYQLESAYNQIGNLNKSGQELSPGDFLQIQVKINKAQQQLEYSSVLVAKSVEGMKKLFDINL